MSTELERTKQALEVAMKRLGVQMFSLDFERFTTTVDAILNPPPEMEEWR